MIILAASIISIPLWLIVKAINDLKLTVTINGNIDGNNQKPVALFEYLIKTYTNEGDLVMDNCAGSCTTAMACLKTNRNYICIEKEPEYCEIGRKRIHEYHQQTRLEF
jgi:site-specific DNA-methyltransferase (adenine-specific)